MQKIRPSFGHMQTNLKPKLELYWFHKVISKKKIALNILIWFNHTLIVTHDPAPHSIPSVLTNSFVSVCQLL